LVLNDGCCINIKQDPATDAKTNKNVSSKNYYVNRLMIRRDQDKVILRCLELCQQFMVDMYVNTKNHEWLAERAILAAKNVDVNELNLNM
jgi:hypothetical protein